MLVESSTSTASKKGPKKRWFCTNRRFLLNCCLITAGTHWSPDVESKSLRLIETLLSRAEERTGDEIESVFRFWCGSGKRKQSGQHEGEHPKTRAIEFSFVFYAMKRERNCFIRNPRTFKSGWIITNHKKTATVFSGMRNNSVLNILRV